MFLPKIYEERERSKGTSDVPTESSPALRNDLVHGLAVIPNTILGALITFSDYPLYDTYAEVEHPINIGLMTDQQLGGLLLWLLGDMMSIMAAATMMFVWFQQEEEKE